MAAKNYKILFIVRFKEEECNVIKTCNIVKLTSLLLITMNPLRNDAVRVSEYDIICLCRTSGFCYYFKVKKIMHLYIVYLR